MRLINLSQGLFTDLRNYLTIDTNRATQNRSYDLVLVDDINKYLFYIIYYGPRSLT